ncbi:MAG TPA: LEA type 2 family protein [Chitinophagaceae bacterium]|nr:LEA type 2 family protein [Chitinophagaceae bacterium]
MKIIISTLLLGMITLASCSTSNVKEPEYREIRDIRLIELGILQSTAGIDLVYYNPNNFGVQLSEARGDVYIDNAYFGRFGLEEKVQVGKRSEFVIPAVLKLDMIGALKNQRELLKKKEVMVKIEGLARVKRSGMSVDVPIHYENKQNIEKLRSLISQ